MSDEQQTSQEPKKRKQPLWLIYIALLLSGLLLLADAYNFSHLGRWTGRFGVVLVFSAVALVIGNGRKAGFVAVGIVWVAVIATYLI